MIRLLYIVFIVACLSNCIVDNPDWYKLVCALMACCYMYLFVRGLKIHWKLRCIYEVMRSNKIIYYTGKHCGAINATVSDADFVSNWMNSESDISIRQEVAVMEVNEIINGKI